MHACDGACTCAGLRAVERFERRRRVERDDGPVEGEVGDDGVRRGLGERVPSLREELMLIRLRSTSFTHMHSHFIACIACHAGTWKARVRSCFLRWPSIALTHTVQLTADASADTVRLIGLQSDRDAGMSDASCGATRRRHTSELRAACMPAAAGPCGCVAYASHGGAHTVWRSTRWRS